MRSGIRALITTAMKLQVDRGLFEFRRTVCRARAVNGKPTLFILRQTSHRLWYIPTAHNLQHGRIPSPPPHRDLRASRQPVRGSERFADGFVTARAIGLW